MRETKLKRLILGIGIGTLVLTVAMILVWKLRFYDPLNVEITRETGLYNTATTTAKGLDQALKDEAQAKQKLQLAKAQIGYFRSRFRSLPFDLRDNGTRDATYLRYLNEYFAEYGLAIRRQLLQAANETGVTIDTKIAVNAPPQVPEQVVSPPSGFLKPLTSGSIAITAKGTLPNILLFMERVTRAEILMSVGTVKLDGISPDITASFTLTPYLVASGPSALLPPAAAPAAPAAEGTPAEGTPAGATPATGTPATPPAAT